jgi:hypothetical protein
MQAVKPKPIGKILTLDQVTQQHIMERSTANLTATADHQTFTLTDGSIIVRARNTDKFYKLSPEAIIQLAKDAGRCSMNNAAQIKFSKYLISFENLGNLNLGSEFSVVLNGTSNFLQGFLVAMRTTNQISVEEYQKCMQHVLTTERKLSEENNKKEKKS